MLMVSLKVLHKSIEYIQVISNIICTHPIWCQTTACSLVQLFLWIASLMMVYLYLKLKRIFHVWPMRYVLFATIYLHTMPYVYIMKPKQTTMYVQCSQLHPDTGQFDCMSAQFTHVRKKYLDKVCRLSYWASRSEPTWLSQYLFLYIVIYYICITCHSAMRPFGPHGPLCYAQT